MHNQDEAVLTHYKAGVSVPVLKNYFYGEEILACS